VALILIAVGVLMNHVGVTGKKLLVAVDGIALLALCYYYIIAPGWQPGSPVRAGRGARWLLLALLALVLIGAVLGFAVLYTGS
jgi:hypothetical protein